VKISVIIPVYNDADVLPRALASVKRQTLQPHEVIVVDDCSKRMESLGIAIAVLESRAPARVIRLDQNGGPFVAMNAGVKASTGDAVVFLGADDELHPDWLCRAALELRRERISAVWCWAVLAGSGEIRGGKTGQHSPLWPSHKYCGSGTVIRKSAFNAVGGYYTSGYCQAWADMRLMILLKEQFVVHEVPHPYVTVHQRPHSISNSRREEDVRMEYIRIIDEALARKPHLYSIHYERINADAFQLLGHRAWALRMKRDAARLFRLSFMWRVREYTKYRKPWDWIVGPTRWVAMNAFWLFFERPLSRLAKLLLLIAIIILIVVGLKSIS